MCRLTRKAICKGKSTKLQEGEQCRHLWRRTRTAPEWRWCATSIRRVQRHSLQCTVQLSLQLQPQCFAAARGFSRGLACQIMHVMLSQRRPVKVLFTHMQLWISW